MNILIIDNTAAQLQAAKTQLEALGHTVTCVDSFDQFVLMAMCGARGLRFHEPKLAFDVVLTDLFMPASINGLNPRTAEKYFSEYRYDHGTKEYVVRANPDAPEVPYGIVIALLAAMAGAKLIGVLSIGMTEGGDHHDDPMTWAMDALEHAPLVSLPEEQWRYRFPKSEEEECKAGEGKKRFVRTFTVNGAATAFFTGYACPRIYSDEGKIKDWAAALERLMSL